MIDRKELLADLQKLLVRLEADLLERSESAEVSQVGETLRADYEQAKVVARTAQNYEDWRSDAITQAAAAWVLSCVFVRFLEDNRLIDPPKIAGPGERLRQARDEWELYLAKTSAPNERDYLLGVFDALAELPGTKDVFGAHNPIRELPNWLSGDAARDLLNFFQKINAETGLLIHDFTDPGWDTRFLGDLYQDLSEAARKKYALLQTPEFVEEFILDRTLDPALDEFGLDAPPVLGVDNQPMTQAGFRMIDPACGSGHFLLGSFRRIFDRWQKKEPAAKTRDLVQRALDSIFGVDVNPYAVAIARFRLLLVAMRACGITRLADAPAFHVNLACGDSLLHGPGSAVQTTIGDIAEVHHAYQPEDLRLLRKYLTPGVYHAVVANPPYIIQRDRALNEAYRRRYQSCHMKYSLSVPFMQRIFQLAIKPALPLEDGQGKGALTNGSAGYTGQITANSFMKREFGKKLIETFIPTVDLTHVIDTSGAYIPGHATPTVILFGRHRPPVASTLRSVMGIRGEPSTPDNPAHGLIWSAIIKQIDCPGSQSAFVSAINSPRANFHTHPWSIGGGGIAELKEQLDSHAWKTLRDLTASIGPPSFAGVDDMFYATYSALRTRGVPSELIRPLCKGDVNRDWQLCPDTQCLVPYDREQRLLELDSTAPWARFLWINRSCSAGMLSFGKQTRAELGESWWSWYRWIPDRYRSSVYLPYALLGSHNHFAITRENVVFNGSSPVVSLASDASLEDHLLLLGFLNSSTACFWMKQVSQRKQLTAGDGVRIETLAKVPFEFGATQLAKMPIPEGWGTGNLSQRLLKCTRAIDGLVNQLRTLSARHAIESSLGNMVAIRDTWVKFETERKLIRSQMVAFQEEIDFTVYSMFGLVDESVLSTTCDSFDFVIDAGARPFEILSGKSVDDFSVPSGIPDTWPSEVRVLWQCRMDEIVRSAELRLIEDSQFKRRWIGQQGKYNLKRDLDEFKSACSAWLLDRLESYFDFDGRMNDARRPTAKLAVGLVSVARLADVARQDADFMQVGELYRDDPAFDVQRLVTELVEAESVPTLPILRYKESGLRKRAEWERTWELQRLQDELADRRAVAEKRRQQARDRVRESLQDEFAGLKRTEELLRALCVDVRDHFGSHIEFEPQWDASMMVSWLLHRGIRADGARSVLQKLLDMQEEYRKEAAVLETACGKKCQQDPEYQDAVRERESIPDDPEIDVPPKYVSADFLKSCYWSLRGKLDVPKERWISFPHCEGNDSSLMIAWAGYDHLQLARAISAHYVDVQERLGGRDDPRLVPLLGCLIELLPWIKQWHNEPDAAFDGMRMGDYFEGFINEEARQLGKATDEIKAWTPPQRAAPRGRRKAAT